MHWIQGVVQVWFWAISPVDLTWREWTDIISKRHPPLFVFGFELTICFNIRSRLYVMTCKWLTSHIAIGHRVPNTADARTAGLVLVSNDFMSWKQSLQIIFSIVLLNGLHDMTDYRSHADYMLAFGSSFGTNTLCLQVSPKRKDSILKPRTGGREPSLMLTLAWPIALLCTSMTARPAGVPTANYSLTARSVHWQVSSHL